MSSVEQGIAPLQEVLDAKRAGSKASDADKAIIKSAIDSLAASGIVDNTLKVGQQAPDFSLPSVDGSHLRLSDALEQGPVVLVFYRGAWCPYCNLALRAYQQILPQIRALGGQIIAVSPQTPDNSLSTVEKDELEFPVLSDEGNQVARAYGLVFQLPDGLIEVYRRFGNDLERYNGNDAWELPVPGTYVVDQNGSVVYAFAKADYVQRAEPSDLLAALESLKR